MQHIVALFGEAEKGSWERPYVVKELPDLVDVLGNPPPESEGLFFAVQALLFKRQLIYFRVQDEGLSKTDYILGLQFLRNRKKVKKIHALCLPGVGDRDILNVSSLICEMHKSPLITTQKDLFDYLTT